MITFAYYFYIFNGNPQCQRTPFVNIIYPYILLWHQSKDIP